jgi:hypothetical protein
MSNYTKTVDFSAKDVLLTGNPSKAGRGSEVDTEFNNIATAIASKADTSALSSYVLSSSYTAADVLAKLLTVDGSSSGLNADLLDGESGNFYQTATNLTAGTIPDGRVPLSAVAQHNRNITSKAGVAKTLQSGGSASGGSDGDIIYIY